jgi:putative intracellular protease/amidase
MNKSALIIIPKSQFCEEELYGIRSALENKQIRVVVLSRSGKEAIGMKKDKFQPDGMIVDWNRQPGIQGKYNIVILVGGKGARKSLWDDPIIPQILTDHHRSGSIVGAIGSALVVLVRASLVTGEIPLPKDADSLKELEILNAVCVDIPVTHTNNIILGQSSDSIGSFSEKIFNLIDSDED